MNPRSVGLSLVTVMAVFTPPPSLAGASAPSDGPAAVTVPDHETSTWERFPHGMLFPELVADPRAPRTHTALATTRLDDAQFLAGLAGFGVDFGLFRRSPSRRGGQWQISLAGGVNALFDMDASSRDLMDANYQIGLPVTWRREGLAVRTRLYHISAHQGDDFLENEDAIIKVPVRNMSFEGLETMVAATLSRWTVYGGAAKLISTGEDLRPWLLRGGVMVSGDLSRAPGWRWTLALDLHSWQENHWNLDATFKGGVELAGSRRPDRALRFLLQASRGRCPYYQFYDLEWRSLGAGLAYLF